MIFRSFLFFDLIVIDSIYTLAYWVIFVKTVECSQYFLLILSGLHPAHTTFASSAIAAGMFQKLYQPQSGISRYSPDPIHNCINPIWRHIQTKSQLSLT